MGEKEKYTQLHIGTTYKLTHADFIVYPLECDFRGNYRRKTPKVIRASGITIGEFLGTDQQVRQQDSALELTRIIEAHNCLIFNPTDDSIQALGLSTPKEQVLIALNYDCEHFLEPVELH